MPGIRWKIRRLRRYRTFGGRRVKQRKVALTLILIIVLVAGIVYYANAQIDNHLVQVYKELDKKDLDLQGLDPGGKDVVEGAKEIYCGTQLDKALDYLNQLREKGLFLKIDSIKYGDIKVLKDSWDSAVLLVESNYTGAFVKAGKTEEIGRELVVNNLCQVELAKTGGQWKIAEVVVLRED